MPRSGGRLFWAPVQCPRRASKHGMNFAQTRFSTRTRRGASTLEYVILISCVLLAAVGVKVHGRAVRERAERQARCVGAFDVDECMSGTSAARSYAEESGQA